LGCISVLEVRPIGKPRLLPFQSRMKISLSNKRILDASGQKKNKNHFRPISEQTCALKFGNSILLLQKGSSKKARTNPFRIYFIVVLLINVSSGMRLKPNLLGMIGVIFALASLTLPWWVMNAGTYVFSLQEGVSASGLETVSLYPYQLTVSNDYEFRIAVALFGFSSPTSLDIWYGWIALVLIIVGSIICTVGSILSNGKKTLIGGVLVLSSLAVFAVGLLNQLSQTL
jgi:hypothetical protein